MTDRSNIVPLPRQDQWLFSIAVFRAAKDGKLVARLQDARTELIEAEPSDSGIKLQLIADMLEVAITAMRAEAAALSEET